METKESHDLLMFKNYTNLCAIRYMMAAGVIKDEMDYAKDGYAEAMSMLLDGTIRVARDDEVDGMVADTKRLIFPQ